MLLLYLLILPMLLVGTNNDSATPICPTPPTLDAKVGILAGCLVDDANEAFDDSTNDDDDDEGDD